MEMNFRDFTRYVGELIYGGNVEDMKAVIIPDSNGGAELRYNGGALIQTYSRARDAKRGAARLGLNVIPTEMAS